MSRSSSLAKNTLIIFLGTMCTKLITFLLLPLYTDVLTTEEFGTLELVNTVISLVVPILYIQIDQGVFRFLIDSRKNDDDKNSIISTCFYFYTFLSVIYFIIFLMLCPFIGGNLKYLVFLNIIFNSLISLILQISRGLGKNIDYSISSFLIALVTILLNIFFLVILKYKINSLLVSLVIGYIFGIIYVVIKLKIYKIVKYKCFDFLILKKILRYSFPLVPNSLSWWVFSVSDRVIISIFIGLSATGLLSVSYKFSNAYILLYNIFNMSLTESIALHINDDDIEQYYSSVFSTIIKIFMWFMIVFVSALPFVFKIMINNNYNDSYNLIPIAMLASFFQVVVGLLGVIYIANNNTKAIAISSIYSAIINIVSDILLIKFIGIYSAVVSTLFSFLVLFIYRLYEINKLYFTIKINIKKIFAYTVLIIITFIVYYKLDFYMKLLYFVTVGIVCIINNKLEISKCLNLIKRKVMKK